MKKKMVAAVLMAAMTASLLAGCGNSKSADSGKTETSQTESTGDASSDLKDGKT